jgi:hypothetical protein
MTFTISAVVQGTPPLFTAQWMQTGGGYASIRFGSSVATTVKQVKVYNSLSQEVYANTNQNLPISKGGYSTQINISNYLSVANYYIVVVFQSPIGEYLRRYGFGFGLGQNNIWYDAGLISSVN